MSARFVIKKEAEYGKPSNAPIDTIKNPNINGQKECKKQQELPTIKDNGRFFIVIKQCSYILYKYTEVHWISTKSKIEKGHNASINRHYFCPAESFGVGGSTTFCVSLG